MQKPLLSSLTLASLLCIAACKGTNKAHHPAGRIPYASPDLSPGDVTMKIISQAGGEVCKTVDGEKVTLAMDPEFVIRFNNKLSEEVTICIKAAIEEIQNNNDDEDIEHEFVLYEEENRSVGRVLKAGSTSGSIYLNPNEEKDVLLCLKTFYPSTTKAEKKTYTSNGEEHHHTVITKKIAHDAVKSCRISVDVINYDTKIITQKVTWSSDQPELLREEGLFK